MPTAWDGRKRKNGKPNPVTLVAAVVARNIAVHVPRRLAVSKPTRTTSPETIPTRLTTTWTNVYVVMSKIMEGVLSALKVRATRSLAQGGRAEAVPPRRGRQPLSTHGLATS